jgi:Ala-tRNA(Pro) deacylase
MAREDAFTTALEREGAEYEVLEHARTERAADEAAALGLRTDEVAKTIVVSTEDGNFRVVLPAADRLDLHKLRELLGAGRELHLLSEEALASEYADFELGAVPPLGGPADPVVVDRRVADLDRVVLEAGAHDRSVRLAAGDLVSATGARVADVCVD